jgi:hypothetical protein
MYMWFDSGVMSLHEEPLHFHEPETAEVKRALIATGIIVALFAVLAFTAPRDPSRIVQGLPCSIVSEAQASAALGTQMRLMPTAGGVCQYVSVGDGSSRTLVVSASSTDRVARIAQAPDASEVTGVGDAAIRSQDALYVRYGTRSYRFSVAPQTSSAASLADEVHVAKLVQPSLVARSR